ncbi:putative ABC transport system ATP-binding protein [Raineyella antarctica]|uniref:Putative ABC transport system ATP-binding protein n=1 Tax=Raineyella antarctica TaxID=1577474 RepID=A0A1G6GDD6_9ACTN|nr:ABC transporter ATP-binding protein [Raineyella antarctica]SDB80007.1 putative ABC transport system ATP-binding protein [Raineyella antarctica]
MSITADATTDQSTAIRARGVRKSFGEGSARTEVLHGIDLAVAEGEFLAIMGHSGSGKSTLLYCLSGMDAVTDGTVHVGGQEITAMSQKDLAAARLTTMGFVFQQVHLLRNLTVLDNVVLPGVTATPRDRAAVVARARGLLERVGIGELADRDITEASGGQLQRAAIARALVNRPAVVFGDEPTGALNATAARGILDLLGEVNAEGRTVVVVTHDINVAARTRRVVVLRDGAVDGDLRRGADHDDASWLATLGGWLTGRGV